MLYVLLFCRARALSPMTSRSKTNVTTPRQSCDSGLGDISRSETNEVWQELLIVKREDILNQIRWDDDEFTEDIRTNILHREAWRYKLYILHISMRTGTTLTFGNSTPSITWL